MLINEILSPLIKTKSTRKLVAVMTMIDRTLLLLDFFEMSLILLMIKWTLKVIITAKTRQKMHPKRSREDTFIGLSSSARLLLLVASIEHDSSHT